MNSLPLSQNSINMNLILIVLLALLFLFVWWRRSLAAVASLALIAVAFIVNQGSSIINAWLNKFHVGPLSGEQLITSFRIAIIIVLSSFVLIVLRHMAKKVPLVVRTLSAAVYSGLLFWYVMKGFHSGYWFTSSHNTQVYQKLHQLYPLLLLAALVLAALELWFVYRASSKPKSKK